MEKGLVGRLGKRTVVRAWRRKSGNKEKSSAKHSGGTKSAHKLTFDMTVKRVQKKGTKGEEAGY